MTIPMDIKRSFEILDLDYTATESEAREAYKDMVNVWHPDRFWNNPRLKMKAEKRLKEVNAAYETVAGFIKDRRKAAGSEGPFPESRTELAAEIGTGIVLGVYSYLSKKLRRVLQERD